METKVTSKDAHKIEVANGKLNAMMAYWDKNLICRFANGAYVEWFGRSPSDMVNRMTLKELLGNTYKKNLPFIEGALRGKPQIFTRLLVTTTGELKNTVAAYYPDFQNGAVHGFFAHVVDISDSSTLEVEKILYQLQSKSNAQASGGNIKKTDGPSYPSDSTMGKVVETLRANILNKFPGLSQLAKIHCISVSKLKRDFKLTYNISPYAYYRNLQMEFADYYMSNTKCSKKEIAAMLDFSNPANFYSLYKKFKNKLPAD